MTNNQLSFQTRYNKLNDAQKKAVNTIFGPVMVVAGPGTGKTEIMGMRVANIVKITDTDPSSILVMTFTDSGVKALKNRLVEIMGTDAYKVNICTFHSFCGQVIAEKPEKFLMTKELTQVGKIEQIEMMRNLIDTLDIKLMRPFGEPYHYVDKALRAISNLKREYITPSKFYEKLKIEEQRVEDDFEINPKTKKPYGRCVDDKETLAKNYELAKIYDEYQKQMFSKGFYDFDDMILFVVEKFKSDESLLLDYQERYLFFLIDEYQDTNSSQNEIISLLTSNNIDEAPNVFVVGDDDQAIYRFQGASLSNILHFHEHFKKPEIIVLTDNYRSTQHILDTSRISIENNKGRISNFVSDITKNLKSQKGTGAKVYQKTFPYEETEKLYVALKIQELIKEGVDPSEIAVFLRNNKGVNNVAEYLERMNIPVNYEGKGNVLDSPIVRIFLSFLSLLIEPYNDLDLITVLNTGLHNFTAREIFSLTKTRMDLEKIKKKKMQLYGVLSNPEYLDKTEIDKEKVDKFLKSIESWHEEMEISSITNFLERFYKETGYLEWIYKKDLSFTYMKHLSSFLSEVKRLNQMDHDLTLKKLLEKLKLYKEYNIKIAEEQFLINKNAVNVMTAHKSKGLEFEYVFIMQCIDGDWGNKKGSFDFKLIEGLVEKVTDKLEKNEDERRLFYVALTRAKKEAYVTHAEVYGVGENASGESPSQFVHEMLEAKDNVDLEKVSDMGISNEDYLKQKLESSRCLIDEEEVFIEQIFEDYKLSASHLKSYQFCPRKFKFDKLLGLPQKTEKSLAFGTAMHDALEHFMLDFKTSGKLPSKEVLITYFNQALEKEILSPKEYDDCLNEGKRSLSGYYDEYANTMILPEYVEYNFSSRNIFLEDSDIHLGGKIDKFEKLNGNSNEVRIVDYKTGQPRSLNYICGGTKEKDASLKQQLLFYKILCDLDTELKKKYSFVEGQIDFIQGKDNDYKKVSLVYTDEDILALKEEIRRVWQEIMNRNFEKTKEFSRCEDCDYYNLCYGAQRENEE